MEEIKLTKMEKMIIKSYLKEAATNITANNRHEKDYKHCSNTILHSHIDKL